MRGAPGEQGEPSHWRERGVAENLDLFARMRAGEFPDGSRTLRARIDMGSQNVWLRDPVLYRIRHTAHHNTGAAWCIYPLYDFAHGLSRLHRGDHAQHLHARVRAASRALRLAARGARAAAPPAPPV
jgi:glutamyl/glutaminyl-tRNA synthetase